MTGLAAFGGPLAATLAATAVGWIAGVLLALPLAALAQHASATRRIAVDALARTLAAAPALLVGAMVAALGSPPAGLAAFACVVLVLATVAAGVLARRLAHAWADVHRRPFMRFATSLGIAPRRVLTTHVLPGIAPDLLSGAAEALGYALASGLLVETLFDWPGMGALAVRSALAGQGGALSAYLLLAGGITLLARARASRLRRRVHA